MSVMSDAMALASRSSGLPPPNASARSVEMNDQVIASSMPRAASARRTMRRRFWIGVNIFGATPESRGNGSTGTRSTPTMRITSSTRSAFMVTSGRQEGTATFTMSPDPDIQKPSRVRMALTSANATLSPVRRSISLKGKSITVSGEPTCPAITVSAGSPPHNSITSRVASSIPGTTLSGSTVRSKR